MNDEEIIWVTRLKEEHAAEIKRLEAIIRYWKWEAAKWGAPDFEYQKRLFEETDVS